MSVIGIYGGTFDPIHNGHLITVQNVAEQRNLDKVIFIPSYISPLKIGKNSQAEKHRLEMVELAIADYPLFDISNYELEQKGVSFSIDTIKHFLTNYDKIEFIIGYDNYLIFDKWKSFNEILDLAKVIVMQRTSDFEAAKHSLKSKFVFLETPVIDISSTLIRNRIKKNKPVKNYLPDAVLNYIETNSLYK